MLKHLEVLKTVVERLAEADAACGVVAQGSVVDGAARPDSDLDLFVVCSTDQPVFNDFIQADNRGRMRLRVPVDGIPIDIGWEYHETLVSLIEQKGAGGWYMFSRGSVARDPAGHAKRIQQRIRDWFTVNPRIAAAWAQQHEEVRKRKVDSSYPLEYPTFADFYRYVQELATRKEGEHPGQPAK